MGVVPPQIKFLANEIRDRFAEIRVLKRRRRLEAGKAIFRVLFNWKNRHAIFDNWKVEANQRDFRIENLAQEVNELQNYFEEGVSKLISKSQEEE